MVFMYRMDQNSKTKIFHFLLKMSDYADANLSLGACTKYFSGTCANVQLCKNASCFAQQRVTYYDPVSCNYSYIGLNWRLQLIYR